MELRVEWVEDPAGRLVRPARADAPLPAALVIQELWGLDAHIEDVSDRFAAAGYLAFAPDLYWPRPPALGRERIRSAEAFLDTVPPSAWGDAEAREEALASRPDADELRETFAALFGGDRSGYVDRLATVVAWLRERAPSVGSVGWCMGGGLSARLTTTAHPPDAAVMFYGAPPEPELHERIAAPILGFFGGDDTRITAMVEPFSASLSALGRSFESHVYEGAPHAFFNDTRASYRVGPSRDAWARTLAFLAAQLHG